MSEYLRSIEVWDKIADEYANKFMHLKLYHSSYDQFLLLLPKERGKVLDVGCGPGVLTRYLLNKSPDLDVLGIDFSPAMVQGAKKFCPEATFRVMDARDMRSLTGLFTGIAAGFIIPYLSVAEREKFLIDANKLLFQGGILYLSYVPRPAERSGYIKRSSGDRLFFHYIETSVLSIILQEKGFEPLQSFTFDYSRSENETETHCAIIARKIEEHLSS